MDSVESFGRKKIADEATYQLLGEGIDVNKHFPSWKRAQLKDIVVSLFVFYGKSLRGIPFWPGVFLGTYPLQDPLFCNCRMLKLILATSQLPIFLIWAHSHPNKNFVGH